jgi:hypothetical protein
VRFFDDGAAVTVQTPVAMWSNVPPPLTPEPTQLFRALTSSRPCQRFNP